MDVSARGGSLPEAARHFLDALSEAKLAPWELVDFQFEELAGGEQQLQQQREELRRIRLEEHSLAQLEGSPMLSEEVEQMFVASFQHLDGELGRPPRPAEELRNGLRSELVEEHTFLLARGATGRLVAFVAWKDLARLPGFAHHGAAAMGIYIAQVAVAPDCKRRHVMAKLLLHLRLRHPDHFLGSIVPKYNAVSRAFSQRWGGQRWDDAVFAQVDKEETYVPGGGAPRHCYTGFRVPPLAAPVDPGRLVCQMGGLAEQFRELAGLGGAAEP